MSQNENKSNYFGLRFIPLLIGFFFAIAIDISFRISGLYVISIAMLIGGVTTGYMIADDIKAILINCGILGFVLGIILSIFNVIQYLLTYLSILPQYQTLDIVYYILGTIVLGAVFGVILGIIGGIFGSQINKKSFRNEPIVKSTNEVPKEDKIEPEETKFEEPVPKNVEVNNSATPDTLNADISYHNDEWNFSMNYPASWDIIYENEPAGTWMVPISVAGKTEGGLRPSFMVNAHHYQILEGDNSTTVTRMYDDGSVRASPKTAAEYIDLTKDNLASQFPGIQFINEESITMEGYPAARQVYSYDGVNGRRIQEESITIFGDNTTFQLISEIPVDQIKKHRPTMQKILESFKIGTKTSDIENIEQKSVASPSSKNDDSIKSDGSENNENNEIHDVSAKITEVTNILPQITLIDARNLGEAGPGGASFQTAVQYLNQDNYNEAESSFLDAINQGLDPLRIGYSYANIGNIKLKQNDLDNAINYFVKVFEDKKVLYESAHTSSGYLKIICSEIGLYNEANAFETLSNQTNNKLGYSLSQEAADSVRQLVNAKY